MCNKAEISDDNAEQIEEVLLRPENESSKVITPRIAGVKRNISVKDEAAAENTIENPITKYSRPKRQRVVRRNAGRNGTENVGVLNVPVKSKDGKPATSATTIHRNSSSSSSSYLSSSPHYSDNNMQIEKMPSSFAALKLTANNSGSSNSSNSLIPYDIDELTVLYLDAIRHDKASLYILEALSNKSYFALGLLMCLSAEDQRKAEDIANRLPNFYAYFVEQVENSSSHSLENMCSQYILGICHFYDITTVDDSQEAAVEYFQRSADQGYCPAMYYIGRCYHFGLVMENDPIRAMEYYQRAGGEKGGRFRHPIALCALGALYEEGDDGIEINPAKAIEMYRDAGSFPEALVRLGSCYRRGIGFKDDVLGADCYDQAARLNYPIAMHNLALCYLNGFGVPKNPIRAADLFQQASDIYQDPDTLYELGKLYRDGIVRGKVKEGKQLLKLAAACEHDLAQEELDSMRSKQTRTSKTKNSASRKSYAKGSKKSKKGSKIRI